MILMALADSHEEDWQPAAPHQPFAIRSIFCHSLVNFSGMLYLQKMLASLLLIAENGGDPAC